MRFENVSKKYRLGLTRTSVPRLVADKLRNIVYHRDKARRDQVLWALRDVTFELSHGESMALVGPNGAGKSTLLKLLSRITLPTQGKISAQGRLSALLELGAGFHPDLTGRENIYLNGTILGLSRHYISRRFDEIVAFAGLDKFIDTPVKRYSSGMEVRLGFSVAACIEPDILLVDEVLAVGDAQFREKCLQRIRGMIEAGTSVIFVSHNLYMVQAVCTRALYIDKGQIRCADEASKVIERYERDIHQQRAERFDASRAQAAEGQPDPTAVEIVGVTVHGATTDSDDALDSACPGRVLIQYEAYSDVSRVNLALFIIRSDGLTCAMARSKLSGFDVIPSRSRGTIRVEFDPLQLATGTYFVEVELTNASDSMVLKAAPTRSAWFSVKGRSRSYDARSGVFEPSVSWQHVDEGHAVA